MHKTQMSGDLRIEDEDEEEGRSSHKASRAIFQKVLLKQVRQRTEILATFLPNEILNLSPDQLNDCSSYRFMGVIFLLDIVGFTTVCEKYRKTGRGGIYKLTACLNAYIGAIIEIIQFFEGDILKFSGEGLLALWKIPPSVCLYEVIHKVIVCSLFIQQNIGKFETEVNVALSLKLGISCGNITFTVVGRNEIKAFLIVGQAIYDVRNAATLCDRGEVTVAASAWGHISEKNYEVTYGLDGVVKIWKCLYFAYQQKLNISYHEKFIVSLDLCNRHITHRKEMQDDLESRRNLRFISTLPKRTTVQASYSKWIPNDLKPFVIKLVQNYIDTNQPIEYLTEMKEVTCMIVFVVPKSVKEHEVMPIVTNSFELVDEIVSKVKGIFYKVMLFHKNITIYSVFGLRGVKHEMESQHALKAAWKIQNTIKALSVENITIGIGSGLVYCGAIGHPFRKEYAIIGGAVKKAEQMIYSYSGKITCDYDTYKNSKLTGSHFELQDQQDDDYIFEYNETFEKLPQIPRNAFTLVGRQRETEIAVQFFKSQNLTVNGLLFKGQSKTGRTKLIETIFELSKDVTKYQIAVTLQSELIRPYFCVSRLYQHLYDRIALIDSQQLKDLPRILWDLGEVLQMSHNKPKAYNAAKNLTNHFFQLLSKAENIIFFIDNLECVDEKSFEIIIQGISASVFRIVATAQFFDTPNDRMLENIIKKHCRIEQLLPFQSNQILPMICSILNVEGISKKLLFLFQGVGSTRPGWIETSLLKLINNGELELEYTLSSNDGFLFDKSYSIPIMVLVAKLSEKYFRNKDDKLTISAISADLFDTFTPIEQKLLKTASVIGKLFSRALLTAILQIENEKDFAKLIMKLFKQQIFDCGSAFIYSPGFKDESLTCLCYMTETEEDIHKNQTLPKFAFCKIINFRSKIIRTIAYEMMPQKEQKEMHLEIANILENQNNRCPICLHDDSATIMNVIRYNDFRKYCFDKDYKWDKKLHEEQLTTDEYKHIIKKAMIESDLENKNKPKIVLNQPRKFKRRIFDPAYCFCVEILTKVYKDLIYHAENGYHDNKVIFFKMQYAIVLFHLFELDEAIKVLAEASELCKNTFDVKTSEMDIIKKVLFGRIHCILGLCYFKKGNMPAAKNHAILSLRQYDVPMISFTYRLPYSLLNRAFLSRVGRTFHSDNPLIKYDYGMCLNLISNIFATEGRVKFARIAMWRSLACIRRTNENVDILCNVYTNAIDLYNSCSDSHTFEKLERCYYKDLLRYYSNNNTLELYSTCLLAGIMFTIRVMSGKELNESIRLGFRALYMDTNLKIYFYIIRIIPVLTTVLIYTRRIDDAVYVGKILCDVPRNYKNDSLVLYYGFCMDLILETNFYLENISKIVKFAETQYLDIQNPEIENADKHLILSICIYHARIGEDTDLRSCYNWTDSVNFQFKPIINLLKITEFTLLELFAASQMAKVSTVEVCRKITGLLKQCRTVSGKWKLFEPRYFHYMAYFKRLQGKKRSARKWLKKARLLAKKQGNILEDCWISLSEMYWFGGLGLWEEVPPLDWRLARTYSIKQWSQILFPLPYE